MSIQFDFKASLDQFGEKLSSVESLKNEIDELQRTMAESLKKFKELYDSSHMRQFRRKYDAGNESDEDVLRFHRESLELLDLSNEIDHLRNSLDKKKKELNTIIKNQ